MIAPCLSAALFLSLFLFPFFSEASVQHLSYENIGLPRSKKGCLELSSAEFMRRPAHLPVEYDYQCKIMKSRYNCAHHAERSPGGAAWDWVLGYPSVHGNYSLREFMGGCRSVLNLHHKLTKHRQVTAASISNQTRVHIVIAGNSYLRQIFESLYCRCGHVASRALVSLAIEECKHLEGSFNCSRPFPHSRDALNVSTLVPLNALEGCHGYFGENHLSYYGSVAAPRNHDWCTDSLARLDIGMLSFYYIFRPHNYRKIQDLLAAFGIKSNQIDVAVFNDGAGRVFEKILPAQAHIIDFENLYQLMRSKQPWFGVDNIKFFPKQDAHPCMPGPPDDELDMLIAMLHLGIKCVS